MESLSTYRQVIWNHAGKGADLALTYATSVVLARALGIGEFGTYAGAMSLVQLFVVIAAWGLEGTIVRFLSLPEYSTGQRTFLVRRALLLRVAAVTIPCALLVSSPAMFSRWLQADAARLASSVAAFCVARSIIPLLTSVLVARRHIVWWSTSTIIVRSTELLAAVAFLYQQPTVDTVFLVFAGTGLLHALLLLRRSGVAGTEATVSLGPVASFSTTFWTNNILDYVLGRYGDIFLLGFLAVARAHIASYDVAFSLGQIASMALSLGVGGILLSRLSALHGENPLAADALFGSGIKILSLVQIPLLAFLVFHGPRLVSSLYPFQYAEAGALIQGIAGFRILARLFGGGENADFLLAIGKPRSLVNCTLAAAGTNLLLDIVLIPHLGAFGAVIGTGSAGIVASFVSMRVIRRQRSVVVPAASWVWSVAVSCAIAGATTVIPPLPLGGDSVLSATACLAGMWFVLRYSRAFSEEDMTHVLRALRVLRLPVDDAAYDSPVHKEQL
jgi:O-antigen/teichoic acid export membrane protein